MNNVKIFQISSKYSIHSVFLYVKYDKILNLVKYNKRLQKLLNITKKNYYIDYEYKKEVKKEKLPSETLTSEQSNYIFISYAIISIILFLYQYVYIFIFLIKSPYRKLDIGKNNYNLITGFFSFLNYVFFIYFFISILILSVSLDTTSSCWFLFHIINIALYLFIASMLSWIFAVIYDFENHKMNWIVISFIILLSLYIILLFFLLILFLILMKMYSFRYNKYENYYLNKLNGISIEKEKVNNDFISMGYSNQKRFILHNKKNFKYIKSSNHNYILESVNNYRKIYKLQELKCENQIPEFILKGNTEVLLSFNNIIQLGYMKFLFKFEKHEFLIKLRQKDKDILNILSMEDLKKIEIIEKDNYEYIVVSNNYDYDSEYLFLNRNRSLPNIVNTERMQIRNHD